MNTTDAFLDAKRLVGDPVVDPIVERLAGGPADVGRLLAQLFGSPRMPENDPLVGAYLEALRDRPVVDPAEVAFGQGLFQLYGPEILLILGSYSLPLAFAAGNGVQVIHRARRLKEESIRRLCDTAQMVVDVMQPGALQEGGIGWRSARKVRLVHALVRHHVRSDPARPWDPRWGAPINQEDLAGTLLSFSIAVLDGLSKMGAKIASDQADAYIFAWSEVAHLVGLEDSLRPRTAVDAAALALRIGARQFRPTPEGKAMSDQTLTAVQSLFPIEGYANSLTHFFLRETVFGADVAAILQLPEPNWTRWLVRARAAQKRVVLDLLDWVPGAHRRRSFIAARFVQAMILLQRPDGRVPFAVPRSLARHWRVAGMD